MHCISIKQYPFFTSYIVTKLCTAGPLWRVFPNERWIPSQRANNEESVPRHGTIMGNVKNLPLAPTILLVCDRYLDFDILYLYFYMLKIKGTSFARGATYTRGFTVVM